MSLRRDSDRRNAFISWTPTQGVVGYNIRWGIHPSKLYQSYQIFADERSSLELRALNVGQDYYFAINTGGGGVLLSFFF
jgi:xylan 1,4-beta-xylosidase